MGATHLIGRLHLKVMLVVGSVVGVVLVGLLTANRVSQRRALTENAVSSVIHISDATYAGLARPMEAGDGEAIAQHLAVVAQTIPGVEIHLIDSDQGVVFSSAQGALGRAVAERIAVPGLGAAMTAAMGPSAVEKPQRLSEAPPTILRPIRNSPACHHCHGAARPVLGALVVHQTTDEVGARLSADLWRTLGAGIVVALLVVVLGSLLLGVLVVRPLNEISQTAEAIASGDLTRTARGGAGLARQLDRLLGQDEIGQLSHVFEKMAQSLRGILKDLQDSTAVLDRQAGNAKGAATQQSAMAAEQSTVAAQTSTVVAEIAQTSKLATESADAVVGVCDRTAHSATAGQQAVSEALLGLQQLAAQVGSIAGSITELSELTRRISEIVASVEDVAEQSNLLALNAAIEASRAGESGQGFAVVASEMRRLAGKSKEASGQARKLLSQVVAGTRAAVHETEVGSRQADQAAVLAHSAGESIDAMAAAMRESAEAARQIALHARQQTTGIEQIVGAVSQLSAVAGDSVESSRRVEEVAAGLADVSKRLSALAARFKA